MVIEARSSGFSGLQPTRPRPAHPSRSGDAKAASGPTFTVELRTSADLEGVLPAWRALAQRAIEPTPFADPDVLLPALQHLPDGRHVSLLLVWRNDASGRALGGLFPLLIPRSPFASHETRLWQPVLLEFAMPPIDAATAPATIEAALSFCATRGRRSGPLSLPRVPQGSPLMAALGTMTTRPRLGWLAGSMRSDGRRLMTLAATGGASAGEHRGSMGRSGFTVEHARNPLQLRDAVETFLSIEAMAAGACGARAIIQDPGSATFVRTMTRQLGRTQRCRVEIVRPDGDAPAAAIAIDSAGATFAWVAAAAQLGPAGDWLVAYLAEMAKRQGKRLFIVGDDSLSREGAARAGLQLVDVADVLVTAPSGRDPVLAGSLKRRINLGLRDIRVANQRRLHGLLQLRLLRAGRAG